jgi:hypothetical protein
MSALSSPSFAEKTRLHSNHLCGKKRAAIPRSCCMQTLHILVRKICVHAIVIYQFITILYMNCSGAVSKPRRLIAWCGTQELRDEVDALTNQLNSSRQNEEYLGTLKEELMALRMVSFTKHIFHIRRKRNNMEGCHNVSTGFQWGVSTWKRLSRISGPSPLCSTTATCKIMEGLKTAFNCL